MEKLGNSFLFKLIKKKCMKPVYTLLLCCFSLALFAQQEEQYTQFMYYKLGFNPAFAGKDGAPTLSALVRTQWIGIDGAPQTQLLTFNTPALNGRVGIGGTIARQTIGVTENYTFRLLCGIFASISPKRWVRSRLIPTLPSR